MITIKPNGGLANRIRVIASSVAFAAKMDKELVIIWEANNDLNCPYYSLFQPNPLFNVKETSLTRLGQRIKKLTKSYYDFLGKNYPAGFDVVLHENDIFRLKNTEFDFKKLKDASSIFINTCNTFYGHYKENQLNKFFIPIESISHKASLVHNKFIKNTIGIHIRRTDHIPAKNNSPLTAFFEKMEYEIIKNQDSNFFLCTDDNSIENELINKFGKRIIVRQKELSRNTHNGIRDALIDLICLSKTQYIIGSYYSSFSEIAAYLGGLDLVLAIKTKNFNEN